MGWGTVLAHFDVAQIAIYVFWGSFAGLIYYLRREDHREGYPLVPDTAGTDVIMFPPIPPAKFFESPSGEVVSAPRQEAPSRPNGGVRAQAWAGAPLIPTGDPLVDGIGPAAYAVRDDHPEMMIPEYTYEGTGPKVLPLRNAPAYYLAPEDIDPHDLIVVSNDGVVVGRVSDVWIDRGEVQVRFFEIELNAAAGGGTVLMPVNLGELSRKRHELVVPELSAAQISRAPRTAHADTVTPQEDDRISSYFGGGKMYGKPTRMEPLL